MLQGTRRGIDLSPTEEGVVLVESGGGCWIGEVLLMAEILHHLGCMKPYK